MALHTTFLGRIAISPPLCVADVELVRDFGPHDPGFPEGYAKAPLGRCPWMPCDDGCCLHWDGFEKPQMPEAWLRFVIDLVADDHRFEGVVVGERREYRELFSLTVRENQVTRSVLMKGVSEAEAWGGLPLDEEQAGRDAAFERRRMRYRAAVARDQARREDEAHDGSAA